MKKKVLVSGCNGKMGRSICAAINSSEDMYVLAGIDKKQGSAIFPVFTCSCYSALVDLKNRDDLPDVIIDFSSPELSRDIALYAANFGIPIVIGTTKLTPDDIHALQHDYSKRIPVFQSANMSFNMALFQKAVLMVAQQFVDADIEIDEAHHNEKVDSPSGTAKMLADSIIAVREDLTTKKYGRDGLRKKEEIGLSSRRGGKLPGEHTAYFYGDFEMIALKHISYSREVYTDGAIKAARFIMDKKKGFYTMDDLVSM